MINKYPLLIYPFLHIIFNLKCEIISTRGILLINMYKFDNIIYYKLIEYKYCFFFFTIFNLYIFFHIGVNKMKISGIVVEYNPLHNGHVYHINKTKELTNCDVLIAVMSGSFNQRGIPSVIDKWNKTLTALHNGVDLVIELPALYSLSSAEFFSFGAISLLNSLGVVDSICFGSEHGDVTLLSHIAEILNTEPQEFKSVLKAKLKEGLVYPKARTHGISAYLNNNSMANNMSLNDYSKLEDILNSSNNILGIEYIRSLKKLNSDIETYTLKREGAAYNSDELNSIFSSATSIRKFLKSGDSIESLSSHLPVQVYELLKTLGLSKYPFPFYDSMFPYIKHRILTNNGNLLKIPDVSEGLDFKIAKGVLEGISYEAAIDLIKSKRYTYTRISRALCQYFVGFDNYNTGVLRTLPCPYARVLGFNDKGKSILKSIKNNSSIPLYTKLPKDLNDTMKLDIQSTKAYSLINNKVNYNDDYLISPLILK